MTADTELNDLMAYLAAQAEEGDLTYAEAVMVEELLSAFVGDGSLKK